MSITRRALLMATAASPVLLLPGRSLAADSNFASLVGTYRYVGGQAQANKQLEAIDDVCADMNFVFRQFARPRLVKALKPHKTVAFGFDGNNVSIERPRVPLVKGPIGGSRFAWKDPDGRKSSITFRFADDKLTMKVKQPDGSSHYVWAFKRPDRMTLRASIEHEKLPKTLKFRLSYKR